MAGRNTPRVDKDIADHFGELRDFIVETNTTLRRELIAELDAGLTGVRSEMRLGFKAMEAKFDTRFDGLETRFGGLEARFDGLETRFDGLETRFDGLETRFDGLETRFDRLERKLDAVIDPPERTPRRPPE